MSNVRNPHADSRLPKVLDEAARLFRTRGFEGTSVREIAKAVGMLPGSLYCHFETKEALLVAVYIKGVQQIIEAVQSAVRDIADPWERLEAACVAHLEAILRDDDYAQVVVRVRPADVPVAHQSLIERMLSEEIDILVGTQMVAKGHDFPRVTLVGVVGADSSLNLPDFRSAERTFALLSQVAGRAGRGETLGRVLIQTYAPDHYALTCAAGHDYEGFYEQEIACRQPLDYPPFGYLINLVLAGNEEPKVLRAAATLAGGLQHVAGNVEVLGPALCPLARLRGKSRVQILLKSTERQPLRRLLSRLPELRKKIPAGVALAVDVDPVDML